MAERWWAAITKKMSQKLPVGSRSKGHPKRLMPWFRALLLGGNVASSASNDNDDDDWHFVSVLGLDSELLAMLPPDRAVALILLYPTTPELEQYGLRRRNEDAQHHHATEKAPTNVVFLRQVVGGTCGTIAAVHALANCLLQYNNDIVNNNNGVADLFPTDSILSYLLKDAATSRVAAHDDAIDENDDSNTSTIMRRSRAFIESKQVRAAHQAAIAAVQRKDPSSATPAAAGIRQGRHFITYIHWHGMLVELDGRRPMPVVCQGGGGRSSTTGQKTFLQDTAAEISTMLTMAAVTDPSVHVRCSLVALIRPTRS
jgi:Ubiquitin carboxyl-terminal hydrolase, family 1